MPVGRRRIDHIPAKWHCSIIGTCLTIADLRKLVVKARFDLPKTADDYRLHGAIVTWTSQSVLLAKMVTKLLDRRFAATVSRFAEETTEAVLAALWDAHLDAGTVPAAYWALMSHPLECPALRDRAYGEVHMLSHLSGATQRADLRRLAALEAETREQAQALERAAAERAALTTEIATRRREAERTGLQARRVEALEARVAELESGAVLAAARAETQAALKAVEEAEAKADRLQRLILERQEEADRLRQEAHRLIGRVADLEMRLREVASGVQDGFDDLPPDLGRRRILYVGGIGRMVSHLEAATARCNGEFVHHDGGIEDGCPRLAGAVSCADVVVCPVTCVSHEAVDHLKRNCRKACKRFLPLPNHSVSTFMRALRLMGDPQAAASFVRPGA